MNATKAWLVLVTVLGGCAVEQGEGTEVATDAELAAISTSGSLSEDSIAGSSIADATLPEAFELAAPGPTPGPQPSACTGDLNSDGVVNAADQALLFGNWGRSGIGDINGNGIVNAQDLVLLLTNWGSC